MKKVLSLFLAFVLAVGLFPMAAKADDSCPNIKSISVSIQGAASDYYIRKGNTYKIIVTATLLDGTTLELNDSKTFSYLVFSGGSPYVTLGQDGNYETVTANSVGEAAINIRFGAPTSKITAYISFEVNDLIGIRLDSKSGGYEDKLYGLELTEGSNKRSYIDTYWTNNGEWEDVTGSCSFESANTGIATVNNTNDKGRIYAGAPGTTTITVKYDTLTFQYKVTVVDLKIGSQSGTLIAGTGGSASYAVTSTGVFDGMQLSIIWCDSSGNSVSTPTGLSGPSTQPAMSNNSSTYTVTADKTAAAGTYYFKLNIHTIPDIYSDNVQSVTVAPEIRNYSINYNLNGGTNNANNPNSYTCGTGVTLSDPAKTGYTFSGWYTDSSFSSGSKVTSISTTQSGDIGLYAKWAANSYSINYNLNGGTNNANNPNTYTYGIGATFSDPTKMGYTFSGWYTDPSFSSGSKIMSISSTQTGTVNLYAKWTAYSYSIAYNLDGGTNSADNPNIYTYGSTPVTLRNPTKDGDGFGGWYTDSEYKNSVTRIDDMLAGARSNGSIINLYAKWAAIYSINYNLNDGINSVNNPNTYTYGVGTTLSDPTKTGYTFGGWYTDPSFSSGSKVTSISMTQTGAVDLYAKWTVNSYSIIYNLNSGTNSADNPNNYTYGIGAALSDPTKTGCTFGGWYTDSSFSSGSKVTSISTTQTDTVDLYAKWIANSYSISYDLDGGTNSVNNPSTYTFGVGVTLSDPTKTGCTFGGWYTDPSFSSGSKVTLIGTTHIDTVDLYAKWTANSYSVTYNLDGGTNSTDNPSNYTYGVEVTLSDPTKTGYTFGGWYTDSSFSSVSKVTSISTTQADAVHLFAKWTVSSYSVIYNLDGGTNNTKNPATYTYGVGVTLSDPTKIGCTFKGWYTDSSFSSGSKVTSISTTQTRDIHLYAKWTANSYSVTYSLDGGTNNTKNPSTYTFGVGVTLSDAIKMGYSFCGWYTDSSFGSGSKVTSISTTQTGDVHLYAKWTVVVPAAPVTKTDVTVTGTTKTAEDGSPVTVATITSSQSDTSTVNNDVVSIGSITVTMPSTVTNNALGNGTSLTISQGAAPASIQSAVQTVAEKANGTAVAVIEINLNRTTSAGTEAVHNLSGAVTVTISLTDAQIAAIKASSNPHIYYYDSETGTLTDMNATFDLTIKTARFTTSHFSTYVIAQSAAVKPATGSITLDTRSYTMSPKNIYDIGAKLENAANKIVKVHSSRDGIANVTKLKNGNYRITGLKPGASYVIFEIYDKAGKLLNHASVKITVAKGVKQHGEAVRAKSIF